MILLTAIVLVVAAMFAGLWLIERSYARDISGRLKRAHEGWGDALEHAQKSLDLRIKIDRVQAQKTLAEQRVESFRAAASDAKSIPDIAEGGNV